MKETTFYIQTLGCKVNQYESQVIRERFLKNGYIEAGSVDEAGICIVNTCTVTSTSDSKSFRLIHKAIKNKDKCVIVTGCMIEDKDMDISMLAGAKFIVKNKDKYMIPDIIERGQRPKTKDQGFGISRFKAHTRVFVKIQDGCNNLCSYCKVRLVRGVSRSRPFKEVLDECVRLIGNSSKEIVLSGICLGAYGRDISKDLDLCKLINQICGIGGDWRLRLSSIEPKDINDSLVHQFYLEKKLCRHLHIPFQSGDDNVLRRMNRPYTGRDYLDIVNRLKDAVPDIAISTDIMVGFPGETEKEFQNTLDFITEVRPMRVHVFPFSKRKGTKAYNYRDDIDPGIKNERGDRLLHLSRGLSREFVNKFIDTVVEVLVEDTKPRKGCLEGYTDRYIKLFINGPDNLKNQLVNCRLTLTNDKLYGILPL